MLMVCGEALMDVFSQGATPTGLALDARVGGSPFNVAVGLARLNQPVALLASISTDFLGERLMQSLMAEGVDTLAVQRVDQSTTLSLVGLNAEQVPSYAFYGGHAADRQLSSAALRQLPQRLQAIHLGSYATVVEPVAATLRLLVEQSFHHTLISLDPNVRLNVEPDVEVWQTYLRWMLPRTHLLKISDEDLALLLPGVSHTAFAEQALGHGVKLVVVTGGAKGAWGWNARTQAHVGRVAVDVVDTVGAGDTFQAAMLAWLAQHDLLSPEGLESLACESLYELLLYCANAAAITCSRRGADMPRLHELT